MIPTEILTEYHKWKAMKLNPRIVKDNLRNTIYVVLISIDLHPNKEWLEVLR